MIGTDLSVSCMRIATGTELSRRRLQPTNSYAV